MSTNRALIISSLIIFSGLLMSSLISGKSKNDNPSVAIDSSILEKLERNINSLNSNIEDLNVVISKLGNTRNPHFEDDLASSSNSSEYLTVKVEETIKEAVKDHLRVSENQTNPDLEITEDQYQAYDLLSSQLDDPNYRDSMSFYSLTSGNDMKNLPISLQKKIMDKVTGMLNNGEMNEDSFIGGNISR